MGALTSRQNAGVEEVDVPSNSIYRYPPKSGSYFASHFIMGGEKFDSTHPEGYLFGENSDLNFLGNRPVAFPYAAPPPQEPVKTLRSLINIRKDTLRLVNYIPKDNSLQSETVRYKRGVCQQFCLPSHTIDPSEWTEEELGFDLDREVFPIVVLAVVDEGDEHMGHCHVLLATFEKHADGSFCVKPLKQKQVVDGVSYLLQEIYGIENKYNTQDSKVAEDEVSDNSAECVVCLSDVRDTLILPCRHLCLCNTCADTLRYQANNCPICRLPFRALLQIRAMRKKLGPLSPTSFNPIIASQTSDSEEHSSSENIPPGYEVVSLLEALNGPLTPSPAALPLHVLGDSHVSGMLPSYGSDGRLPPIRTLSPLDHLSDCGSQGLKLKKSLSKSISQNSSVLHEEEDEKTCSESEIRISRRKSPRPHEEECGVTPESENLTLSSSGAIDQSSCTGTPLSSTISSPEDPASSSLAQSVMSMASSQSQHSEISTDTMSSMSGSYVAPGTEEEGDMVPSPAVASAVPSEGDSTPVESPDANFVSISAEERDAEGNDVMEEEAGSPMQEDGQRTGAYLGMECDNNNDIGNASVKALDNELCSEACLPGIQTSADNPLNQSQTLRHHFSASSINLECDEDMQFMLGPLGPR
ncbi:E3 ubiquitin ligase RNF157 isoform X7 [Rhineura floridana]|uniref:E3 ubiquitin ligase RNF157 isoform X7 n=1 Tax=Rhineura floridana TaxID=261503 RepID=UPI002AC856F9|nr:E3 ubiquitin ligase RNF157 isoform X7 [Rhineura floridana]